MAVSGSEKHGTRGRVGQSGEGLWMLGFSDRREVQGVG